jgi:hypothetical protein
LSRKLTEAMERSPIVTHGPPSRQRSRLVEVLEGLGRA